MTGKHHPSHYFHNKWEQSSVESFRRRVIAHLSHDLRTPLTIIRRHVFKLGNESLSADGLTSLKNIDHQIMRLNDLMEDLLTYTRITSRKYAFQPIKTDMVYLIRHAAANWYPLFEEENLHFDVNLPDEKTFYWEVDPSWITRVLDHLFHHILRHSVEGKYVETMMELQQERIMITDKGLDMEDYSYDSGADIGFLISNYMLQKMKIQALFSFSNNVAIVEICKSE